MIIGIITPLHQAIIHLLVWGQRGQEEEVEAIIDTGFNGFLMLPPETIIRLGLTLLGVTQVILADGRNIQSPIYQATVLWDQEEREVEVLEAGSIALVGMSLLHGCDVRLQVVDGGSVMIEALS